MSLSPMASLVPNLLQRLHHEIALLHQGMGDMEFGFIHHPVIVEQDVDIDDTVVVLSAHRLPRSSQLALNALREPQHLFGRACGETANASIDKHIG